MAVTQEHPVGVDGLSLVDFLLLDQRQLTAVEKFSRIHEFSDEIPHQEKYYRDLMPVSPLQPGEQYAFEVDMDKCTGCKACVTACHSLNGLDETETWRSVGLLHGGTAKKPFQQTVTHACHHCADPACMNGCPVKAYEKDEVTGIVKHLDDQCIGCQYCSLKCPYDVPKYNEAKGIVRKCDMCSNRLAVGEAPACVQACPSSAIKIVKVQKESVLARAAAGEFLPGAPAPDYTKPSTLYKRSKPIPAEIAAADAARIHPEHSHLPLVFMLVITQMAVGSLAVEAAIKAVAGPAPFGMWSGLFSVAAMTIGLIGMNLALLHLGRPLYAWRAVLGLKTSWLSREIVGFGIFAGAAHAYVGLAALPLAAPYLPAVVQPYLAYVPFHLAPLAGLATVAAGLLGVFCSAMIYIDTRRPFWSFKRTVIKFFGTAATLGLPTAVALGLGIATFGGDVSAAQIMDNFGRALCIGTIAVTLAKLAYESSIFRHSDDEGHNPLKGTALLMSTVLRWATIARNACGLIGGVILPAAMALEPFAPGLMLGTAILMTLLVLAGELFERYLFFTAVVAPRMPGALTS